MIRRLSSFALPAAILPAAAALAFSAAPASAQSGPAFYRVELASPLDSSFREVINGAVWRCEGSICTGSRASSRPAIICGRLARKVGTITSFAYGDEVLDDEALTRCNRG